MVFREVLTVELVFLNSTTYVSNAVTADFLNRPEQYVALSAEEISKRFSSVVLCSKSITGAGWAVGELPINTKELFCFHIRLFWLPWPVRVFSYRCVAVMLIGLFTMTVTFCVATSRRLPVISGNVVENS